MPVCNLAFPQYKPWRGVPDNKVAHGSDWQTIAQVARRPEAWYAPGYSAVFYTG
ncbi:hypothetical protein GCM10023116_16620 [Kistimonas scapharcae]|uniref:Uncharacterized protein n=1 Tax=Kistimonas scapharcae TaxID=1036133 RepID=A0ABP8V1T6_9GAMM